MPRRAVRTALALTLSAAALCGLTSCGVALQAPRFIVNVLPSGLAVDIRSRGLVPIGETVVEIYNQSDCTVRVLLLEDAPPVHALPPEVLDADTARDSDLVLGSAPKLKKRTNQLATGGLGYSIHSATFHVFLSKGHRYSLVTVGPEGVQGLDVVAGTST